MNDSVMGGNSVSLYVSGKGLKRNMSLESGIRGGQEMLKTSREIIKGRRCDWNERCYITM